MFIQLTGLLSGAFESIVRNVHQAGYLHNSLSRSNLLVRSIRNATVCVVGFADANPIRTDRIEGSDANGAGPRPNDGDIESPQAKEVEILKEILAGPRRDDEDYVSKRSRFLRETELLLLGNDSGDTSHSDDESHATL